MRTEPPTPIPAVLSFATIDRTQLEVVGGKGAHLGELARIEGIHVPAGFCVTTAAFGRMIASEPAIAEPIERLSRLRADDVESIRALSAAIRLTLESVAMPEDVAAAITREIAVLGEDHACAVRSSATAEDLPTASFAGQHDTYLNVVGAAAILQHVSRCWASLFTERAVVYRIRNRVAHRSVRMAVVVQRMVFPDVSGVMFTADPVTSNRRVVSIEAAYGLGESLVSGRMNPDVYTVRDGKIVTKAISSKDTAIEPSPKGGTRERPIGPGKRDREALTDAHVVQLETLGRRVEAHFGHPQDIEWCLAEDRFHVVQSRPITTLFPVPVVSDRENHVYLSVGHQQMMTDPMKPLGLSVWQLMAFRPMHAAGGRLFVDVTESLASASSRAAFLDMVGKSDPLMADALQSIVDRGNFLPQRPDEGPGRPLPGRPPGGGPPAPIETDPAIVTELISRTEASIAALRRDIETTSGSALFDFIVADIEEQKRAMAASPTMPVIMAGMEAAWWLNARLQAWLGETNAADTLTQSVPNNVTSEMGLALLDVADVIRPHPAVVAFLRDVEDDAFLEELPALDGGRAARDAIAHYLAVYGMRCIGEIDITRPRWSEHPAALVPVLLANVETFEPGERARRFERGRRQAMDKEQELLDRLRALPDGRQKADETKQMIDRVRTFAGYREHPKYGIVSRAFVYKQALLREAERLAQDGVLSEVEDIFFLTFQELRDVVRTREVDTELIRRREEELRSFDALTPPRVLTSDGEVVTGAYRRDDLPAGALVGLAVSTGIVEGRARVIRGMGDARLEAGDIVVTAHTDPSWSPLFVAASALVTEVGGLMTHGAVIAREYGLPAVVGVHDATRLIEDGQRIRVNGTHGYVEILAPR